MVDEKRKRQIIHQLAQVAPAGQLKSVLRSASLRREEVLAFIRKIEKLVAEQDLRNSSIFYWSSCEASWMMPERSDLFELSRTVSSVFRFSEDRQEQLEEFCFSCIGSELSVVLYGFCVESDSDVVTYECVGSLDAPVTKRVLQTMSPYLEFIDPLDAHKLDSSLTKMSAPQTVPHFMNSLQHYWGELCVPPSARTGPTAQTTQITQTGPAVKSAPGATKSQSTGSAAQNTDANQEQSWIQLSSTYPYPIANPYRALDGITNASEKYKEQLKLIENLLALLAGMCLSISAQNEPRILAELREYVGHGVSMGHWRELIRKSVSSWKNNSTKEIPLAKAISNLRIEQTAVGFGKAVEQLIRTRNDFAHHRGPTAESEIEKDTVRVGELLEECLKFTSFLCNHPIRIVKAIDVLPSGAIKMICLKAVGDHPVLRQEELCLSKGFPKGQLILDTGESNWLSLYPFLTQDICPSCGTMEIYHLDKWRYEKDRMQVRSFERGHAQESSAIALDLKAIVVPLGSSSRF